MNQRIQLSDHFTTSRILRFAASPIIMMVFTSIYSVVDGFFVSNFAGKQAFAAVNLIMPFLQAFGCIGFMLGTGGSALVAMTLGTGNKKRANELFSMLVCATAVLGVIFTVVALLVLRPAAVLLGATAELLDDCILYGTIITVFQTAFMLQFLFQSFFITAEKPKLGLFFTVAAGLTNMVLDFVFVGVMGLGITGAAAATVISQLIGGIGPMFYFARPGNGSLLHFVRPVFSGKALLKACTNGSSELMTNLSASLVGALYNWQLLRLGGADGVAAYGVIMYVSFIFAAIFIGYAQGCAPVVSYHYGADNTDELKNLLRISLRVIAVGGVAMLCFSELLAAPLSRFFVGYDAELLELTTLGMKLYSLSFLLCGFNIFGSAFFTALNNGIVSAVTPRLGAGERGVHQARAGGPAPRRQDGHRPRALRHCRPAQPFQRAADGFASLQGCHGRMPQRQPGQRPQAAPQAGDERFHLPRYLGYRGHRLPADPEPPADPQH